MKIDTNDIRQRLSQNTAIDAKEIQALCDEVERYRIEINGLINDVEKISAELIEEAPNYLDYSDGVISLRDEVDSLLRKIDKRTEIAIQKVLE